MASAKLIKSLERKGFILEFPEYGSLEEEIIEIIKTDNPRLALSLPLLLMEKFDYMKTCSRLNALEKKEFDKAILISEKIYKKENIPNTLNALIKINKIKSKFSSDEFNEFYTIFKESHLNREQSEQKTIEKQSKLRLNLNLNKDLKTLFSPAKIRIMEKIFNHEKLTNTELKYYYKSISNINKATLNPQLENYLRIIETTKKNH
ncbi:TPA: hypothetical protein HA371_05105 [Candidatus Woesearchaeota archaeon]|nr:hypothetical protein [Candidatus Woesearchaeota archaeon]